MVTSTPSNAYAEPLLRQTASGPVLGFIDTHPTAERSLGPTNVDGGLAPVRKWLGIPYAQAQRFQRCSPPEPWHDPRTAYEFGPAFPQPPSPFDAMYQDRKGWLTRHHLGQSEDAFSVNVFAPDTDQQRLPVMVWIHGGNFVGGSSNEPIYDPSGLVRQRQQSSTPVIVVSLNYRLGVFGWLATPDLVAENGHMGNFGLHDCIMALEWIQSNIEAFGGDKNRVIAMGESAGAVLIAILLNCGRRVFQRAILESGNHLLLYQYPTPHYDCYDIVLQAIDPKLPAADPHEQLQALKSLSMQDLHARTMKHFYSGQWSLTTDASEKGWSKPLWHYVESAQRDPWIEAVIIGINKDEGSVFNSWEKWYQRENMLRILEYKSMTSDDARPTLDRLYLDTKADAGLRNLKELPSSLYWHDMAYHTPMVHLASCYASPTGPSAQQALPIYVYQFDTLPRRLMEGYENYGVLHTGEIPFVLNVSSLWDHDESSAESKTAVAVGKLWTNFAHGKAPWPAYTANRGEILHIQDEGATVLGDVHSIRPDHMEYWLDLYRKKYADDAGIPRN